MSDHENNYTDDDDSSGDGSHVMTLPRPPDYPLKHNWVMYDHTKSDSETYEASTRKICEFKDVLHFWQIFNNYPSPSRLFNNGVHRPIMKCVSGNKEISSISVFKKGILPKWEDPLNKYGAEFSKRKFGKKDSLKELDSNWIDILIACVGCVIDQSVTGIRVVDSSAPKRNEYTGNVEFKVLYRIELWFDNIAKKGVIEDQFKNILNIEDPKAIYYKEHNIVTDP
jgi:hypothetical protein